MQLHGIHHVTAITGDVADNLDFYTRVLGLRLVKKSVNQDDTSAYHLFYADKLGTPGTDMTFFDWPQTPPNQRGTDSITLTMFRVNGAAALDYWGSRFDSLGVKHGARYTFAGREYLPFEDNEGQRIALVDDGGAPFEGEAWDAAGIPLEYAIRGFYGVGLSVPELKQVEVILTQVLGFSEVQRLPDPHLPADQVVVYAMDGGGAGREVHVTIQPDAEIAWPGRGGVHHVAFRLTDDDEYRQWHQWLSRVGMPNSGPVDRYYFKSLYFRISGGILFELATDGPGFATDEPLESLGERLALPPFLEPRRDQIEAGLKPIKPHGA
jgi:glyoxalase family protein